MWSGVLRSLHSSKVDVAISLPRRGLLRDLPSPSWLNCGEGWKFKFCTWLESSKWLCLKASVYSSCYFLMLFILIYFNDFFFNPALFPMIIFFELKGDKGLFPSITLLSSWRILLELLFISPDEFNLDLPKEWDNASKSWMCSSLF